MEDGRRDSVRERRWFTPAKLETFTLKNQAFGDSAVVKGRRRRGFNERHKAYILVLHVLDVLQNPSSNSLLPFVRHVIQTEEEKVLHHTSPWSSRQGECRRDTLSGYPSNLGIGRQVMEPRSTWTYSLAAAHCQATQWNLKSTCGSDRLRRGWGTRKEPAHWY